ncbi:MAG TPA: NAD-dependent epimerase/dehydratase family protein [Chloroflexota bacterium]
MRPVIAGKRILITGGAGFIGSALTRRLSDRNDIVIFDSGLRGDVGSERWLGYPNVSVAVGDVLDADALAAAMRGCHIVVHLAAIAGVDTVLQMPVTTMQVSMIGTFNALEAALREPNIERFVDFSTSEVFGSYAYNVREGDVTTLGAVGEARWTYAVSKLATEHLTHNYHKQYGLPGLSVRPFNVYGPGQVGEGAIHNFVVRAIRDEPLQIHNDGSQIRAWCYIDDIVDGLLLCLARPEAVGQSFNIGNPRSVCTIYDLARHVVRLSSSASDLVFVERSYTDVELRVPNIDKARELLGYEPKVDLEEGIQRTVEWYRNDAREGAAAEHSPVMIDGAQPR